MVTPLFCGSTKAISATEDKVIDDEITRKIAAEKVENAVAALAFGSTEIRSKGS